MIHAFPDSRFTIARLVANGYTVAAARLEVEHRHRAWCGVRRLGARMLAFGEVPRDLGRVTCLDCRNRIEAFLKEVGERYDDA